jgi:hypothetical protein
MIKQALTSNLGVGQSKQKISRQLPFLSNFSEFGHLTDEISDNKPENHQDVTLTQPRLGLLNVDCWPKFSRGLFDKVTPRTHKSS